MAGPGLLGTAPSRRDQPFEVASAGRVRRETARKDGAWEQAPISERSKTLKVKSMGVSGAKQTRTAKRVGATIREDGAFGLSKLGGRRSKTPATEVDGRKPGLLKA
jgi:hypothetical protein